MRDAGGVLGLVMVVGVQLWVSVFVAIKRRRSLLMSQYRAKGHILIPTLVMQA